MKVKLIQLKQIYQLESKIQMKTIKIKFLPITKILYNLHKMDYFMMILPNSRQIRQNQRGQMKLHKLTRLIHKRS